MSTSQALQLADERPPIPEYILDACQAAGEWWAKSEQDPRFKFQPSVVLKLLSAIREGAHYEPACSIAGMSYGQLRNWLNAAEDNGPESPHGRFAVALKIAESEAELETMSYVRAASRDPRFWAAGMTFLERRHPDRWKRRDDNAVQVNIGVALGVQASETQRQAIVPIIEIAPINAISSPHGAALSPSPESANALSPTAPMPVSVDMGEAKATPNDSVSPPSVA